MNTSEEKIPQPSSYKIKDNLCVMTERHTAMPYMFKMLVEGLDSKSRMKDIDTVQRKYDEILNIIRQTLEQEIEDEQGRHRIARLVGNLIFDTADMYDALINARVIIGAYPYHEEFMLILPKDLEEPLDKEM